MTTAPEVAKKTATGTIVALLVCVFAITTGEFVIAGILPAVAGDLRVSIPAAGLLVTAYAVGMIVGGPVLTALTARQPRRRLVLVLLLVAIAGNVVSALAPSYGVLFGARVVTALVTSTFFANAVVIAISSAEPGREGATVAKLAFGMNLAMIAGAPLGTWIGAEVGWRVTFWAITGCCLAGLALVLRLVPEVAAAGGSALAELRVLYRREVQLAIAVTAVANLGVLMIFTYLAPLLTDLTGFAATAVAPLLLAYGLGATIGNLVGGRLADRAPKRSQLSLIAVLAAVIAGLWLVREGTAATAVLVFVLGAAAFAVIPGMQARVLTTASSAPTLAMAVNASAYQVAAAFAGWIGGATITGLGLGSLYLVAAAATVAGLALSAYAWRVSGSPRG